MLSWSLFCNTCQPTRCLQPMTPIRNNKKRGILIHTPDRENNRLPPRPATPAAHKSYTLKSPGRSRSNTPTRDRSAVVTPDVEKLKRQGMFRCKDETYPICNHQIKSKDNKKLCRDWTYIGRACTRQNCPFLHANSLASIPGSEDKKFICTFVDDNPPVTWDHGKGPATDRG